MSRICPDCQSSMDRVGNVFECSVCGSMTQPEYLHAFCESCKHERRFICYYDDHWECPVCSHLYTRVELEKDENMFGVCPTCRTAAVFEGEGDDFYVCQCCYNSTHQVEILPIDVPEKVHWKQRTGCPSCGAESAVENLGAATATYVCECEACNLLYKSVPNVRHVCDCDEFSDASQVIPVSQRPDEHVFYCFDCRKVFEVKFEFHTCGNRCPISPTSAMGHLYYCSVCDTDWYPSNGGTSLEFDWDDDDDDWPAFHSGRVVYSTSSWGWFEERPFEQALEAALVVDEEL